MTSARQKKWTFKPRQIIIMWEDFIHNTEALAVEGNNLWGHCPSLTYWSRALNFTFDQIQLCHVTCCLVSTDVEQAGAPLSSRLGDGGDGGRGDAEAGLREDDVLYCREFAAIFTSCGGILHFLLFPGWGFPDGRLWPKISWLKRFVCKVKIVAFLINAVHSFPL